MGNARVAAVALRSALFAALFWTTFSAEGAGVCDDLSALPLNTGVQWSYVWEVLNNDAPCTQNCHTGTLPTGELDLGSQQLSIYFLVGQPSSQDSGVLRVEPGHPERSLLFQKVSCSYPDAGGPMPPPGGHLPTYIQALIWDWIAQGAYGEGSEDPIPRDFMYQDSFESERLGPLLGRAEPATPLEGTGPCAS